MRSHNVIWGHKSGQGVGIHGALCSRRIANPHTHNISPLPESLSLQTHTGLFSPWHGNRKTRESKNEGGKKEIVFERKWGWVSQSWGFGTATDDISTLSRRCPRGLPPVGHGATALPQRCRTVVSQQRSATRYKRKQWCPFMTLSSLLLLYGNCLVVTSEVERHHNF